MKIYTKTGDQGQTSLYGGRRVPKSEPRIDVYGTFDELNAQLGVVVTALDPETSGLLKPLLRVQSELFDLGAEIATPEDARTQTVLLSLESVQWLENEIDTFEKDLAPLKQFILPGGTVAAAHLHVARTVCRRAERKLVEFHHQFPVRLEAIQYLNRLSDWLFVAARWANHQAGEADIPWVQGTRRNN